MLSSTTFRAQPTSSAHTLSFAELTYGASINSLAHDAAGNVWFAGRTCSPSLPTTAGALQPSAPAASCNGVFGRMTAAGTVTYLSYLGGLASSGTTYLQAIALDAGGNVYLAGYTYATDFPTTPGAFDRTCGSDGTCTTNKWVGGHFMNAATTDGFVMKLTPAADRMVYSTYFGGADNDNLLAIGVDGQGRVHMAGSTISTDLPVTAGALQSGSNDGVDPDDSPLGEGFYARLSADGSSLEYGTYLGGYGYDSASAIAVTATGDALVTGSTTSPNFPTMNAVQPQNASAAYPWYYNPDAWLARFGNSGAQFSTYMGGSSGDGGHAIATFGDQVYVGGSTCSPDFPREPSGSTNCRPFLTTAAASTGAVANTIVWDGGANQLAVDQSGLLYVAGGTISTTLATTSDAHQRTAGGGGDATLAIFDMSAAQPLLSYSTYLGGPNGEGAIAVTPDGAGGAFYAGNVGSSTAQMGFPSHNGQPEPTAESVPNSYPASSYSESWAARVVAQQTTTQGGADVVLYARDASAIAGTWQLVGDATAAAATRIWNPDAGVAKITTPSPSPANYFELTFNAQAGVPYHLWLRMKADSDSYQNDSVFVQFSDSVDGSGNPVWRLGTPSATFISLERCSGCGEQGWGWADNGYGSVGQNVSFATSGPHTLRIQQREDGVSIDQVILSSGTWAANAPGASRNDATIVPQGAPPPNVPPQVFLASPANGATYTAPAAITITANAADNDGTVTKLDLYANGTLLSTSSSASSSFTWTGVPAGTYRLTAVATDNGGATTTSNAAAVTVTTPSSSGALPQGWADADVGAVGTAGHAAFDPNTGTYTVHGAGADVWGTDDAFNYAYTPLSGDVTIIARVASVSNEANWVKAGVMIRGSLSPSSAQAFMLVSYAKGIAFQRRVSDGNISVSTAGGMVPAPYWVKLVRAGNVMTASASGDGVTWFNVGSDTFAMGTDAYAGFAVSSHVAGTPATAAFDHVTITRASAAPPPSSQGDQCASVTLSQTSFYSGGPASKWQINITASSDTCTWTASIDQSWLALNGVTGPTTIAGTGSGKLVLQTLDNRTGANRVGTLTVGGAAYKVTQEPF